MLCPRVAKRSSYCNMRGVLGWQLTRCIVTAWKLCIQINAHPLVSKQRVNNKRMKRKRWEFSPLLSNQWDIYASFCAIIRLCHALTEKGTSCIDFWHKPVHFRVKKRFVDFYLRRSPKISCIKLTSHSTKTSNHDTVFTAWITGDILPMVI